MHPNIKLSLSSSETIIYFLDVNVSLDGNNIHTSVHTKSLDRHVHHCNLFQRYISKKRIVYSHLMTYKRNCSIKSTFQIQTSNLFQHFSPKDYHCALMHNEDRQVCLIELNNLLKHKHMFDTNDNLRIQIFHPTFLK